MLTGCATMCQLNLGFTVVLRAQVAHEVNIYDSQGMKVKH
jgi:hypothetical protein